MEKFKIYYLSFLFIFGTIIFNSCYQKPELYKKDFTESESKAYAKKFISGLHKYYQGTPEEHFLLEEARALDATFSDIYREKGASRVKRGINTEAINAYAKAVQYDAKVWQGYKAYLHLYFYRDYDNAIKDLDALDDLTPNFVDYPQSESVDFMRGICYLMKKENQKALEYFEKFFAHESKSGDLDYIESRAFLYHGIAYYQMDDLQNALAKIELGIKHNKNADLLYWKAKLKKELDADPSEIISILKESKKLMKQGYNSRRPYVEEFHQTYIEDIEDFIKSISSIR